MTPYRTAGVPAAVCVLSVVNWHNVNPFGDAAGTSGWSVLCTACYAAALARPVLLAFTIAGYARGRRQP